MKDYRFWMGWVFLAVGAALVVYATALAPAPGRPPIVFVDTPVVLPAGATEVRIDGQPAEVLHEGDDGKKLVVRPSAQGEHKIEVFGARSPTAVAGSSATSPPAGSTDNPVAQPASTTVLAQFHVSVTPRSIFSIALVGLALLVWGLPFVMRIGQGATDTRGRPINAWYLLLAEPKGGFSLSRVQLLMWFLPTAILWGALSIVKRQFVALDATIAVLLGLSGATTLLGTATSPPQEVPVGAERPAVAPPRVGDLVTDWNGSADLSRYQYFLLTLFGAGVFVSAFFRDLAFVAVPKELLLLLGASQATYIGTKAVKAAKADDPPIVPPATTSGTGATPGSSPAPPTFTIERT